MPGLDGLRALAVTAVVWHHTHPGLSGLPQTRTGFLGVDVFFVLSGFLITTLLLDEQAHSGRISLLRFYVRRSLRIFPLYYALLATLAVYSVAIASATSQLGARFISELPYHATFTSNWLDMSGTHSLMAISWSLSAEEQFYLLWPPVLVWLGRRALWPLVLLIGFNQAINFGILDRWLTTLGFPYANYWILQVTFTPILLGVLLAFAVQHPAARRVLERVTTWRMLAVVLGIVIVATSVDDMRGLPRLAFQLAAATLLAGVVLRPMATPARWLEWKPLAFIGTVSYGVYLLHTIVLHFATRALAKAELVSPTLLFASCLVATIGLAALSYLYFERPLLLLKNRFR